MSTSNDDELRALRERAYGPAADIHHDQQAVARLRALEMRRLAAPPSQPDAAEEADDAILTLIDGVPNRWGDVGREQAGTEPGIDHGTEAGPDHGTEPGVDHAAESGPDLGDDAGGAKTPHRHRRLRVGALWAASIALAVGVTAFVANAVIEVQHDDPHSTGATQAAALAEDPLWAVPGFFFGGGGTDARGFEEFYGMRTVVTTALIDAPGAPQVCLSVARTEDANAATSDSFSGMLFNNCGANGFPAVVTLMTTADMPGQLLAEFPAGTALQFAYDPAGGDVVVFSSLAR